MPAIPDDKEPRWHIWNDLFLVSIPYMQSRSKDHIKMFGMPISGDARHDEAMRSEPLVTMKTIAQLVELAQLGVHITVCKDTDTKVMYEHISDHLQGWRTFLQTAINPGNVPVEELQALDDFGQVLQPHAAKHLSNDFVESFLTRQMRTVMVSREELLPRAKKIDDTPAAPTPFPASRESMAAIFASRETAGKPKW